MGPLGSCHGLGGRAAAPVSSVRAAKKSECRRTGGSNLCMGDYIGNLKLSCATVAATSSVLRCRKVDRGAGGLALACWPRRSCHSDRSKTGPVLAAAGADPLLFLHHASTWFCPRRARRRVIVGRARGPPDSGAVRRTAACCDSFLCTSNSVTCSRPWQTQAEPVHEGFRLFSSMALATVQAANLTMTMMQPVKV